MARIDFDKLLSKGLKSYEREVGDWWMKQSEDAAHKKAYDVIAEHVAQAVRKAGKSRGLVVDYACGHGKLLERLARLLPEARLVGIDGAAKLLERNAERLRALGHDAATMEAGKAFGAGGPRLRLVQSFLPSFRLPTGRADAVIFCFPNITASAADQPHYDRHGYKNRIDVSVARMLARFREMDPEDETSEWTPEEHFEDLMTQKVVSRDLRALLRRGGQLFRVEYSNGERHELSELVQWRTLFCEGALDGVIKDERAELLFRHVRSKYRRSKVILDVYHQTRNPDDKSGGYFISDFVAV